MTQDQQKESAGGALGDRRPASERRFGFERGAGSAREHAHISEYIVPGVLLVFCAVVAYLCTTFDIAPPIVVGEAMQPRSFPLFLMVLIALFTTALIWQIMRDPPGPRERQLPQTWVTIALLGVFYVLATYADP